MMRAPEMPLMPPRTASRHTLLGTEASANKMRPDIHKKTYRRLMAAHEAMRRSGNGAALCGARNVAQYHGDDVITRDSAAYSDTPERSFASEEITRSARQDMR